MKLIETATNTLVSQHDTSAIYVVISYQHYFFSSALNTIVEDYFLTLYLSRRLTVAGSLMALSWQQFSALLTAADEQIMDYRTRSSEQWSYLKIGNLTAPDAVFVDEP